MKRYLPIFIFTLLILPIFAWGQGTEQKFVPLVGIPGLENPEDGTFSNYVNALFELSIGIAAVLAVIKLIMAGVQYMFSEIPSVKSDAKGDIAGALLGLLIILASVTLLNTINPNLTRFDVFEKAQPVQVQLSGSGGQRVNTSTYSSITTALAVAKACGGTHSSIATNKHEVSCPISKVDRVEMYRNYDVAAERAAQCQGTLCFACGDGSGSGGHRVTCPAR